MPSFLIVRSEAADGRVDAFRQPPTVDIGGMRAALDWGDVTFHVPAGDLPVTIFVTRADGGVEGARITVRAPAGTGTRLAFVPSPVEGAAAQLRIEGQWVADSAMHYYAARDARVLVSPTHPLSTAAAHSADRPASPVGPAPGTAAAVPPRPTSFGQRRGADVDPVMAGAGQSAASFGQRDAGQRDAGPSDAAQRDAAQRDAGPSDAAQRDAGQRDDGKRSVPPIITPTEFSRLEQEAHDAQVRAYDAWSAQQRAQAATAQSAARRVESSPHDGAPRPIGTHASTGQPQPAWFPDPFRRADARWFDGREWTSSVMRGGVRQHDRPSLQH